MTASLHGLPPFGADAEPYMHELFLAPSQFDGGMHEQSAVDAHQLEERLQAAAEGVEVEKKKDSKKAKKAKHGTSYRAFHLIWVLLTHRLDLSSGPPSPPESETSSRRLTIAPCPARFRPFIPPPNFGAVEDHKIFRSAFPADRNMDFCKGLDVRVMLYAPSHP